MKLLFLLLFVSTVAMAQDGTQSGILKYDFSTYTGQPIQKGWLFDDATYRKLYKSYNAADTMAVYFEKQGAKLETLIFTFETVKQEYIDKATADAKMIANQQEDIGGLKVLLDTSQKDTADLLKQFWHVGSIRLHKGTTMSVGVSALIIGYMAGKAF